MDRALENERGEVIAMRDAGDPVLGFTHHCAKTRTNQSFIVGSEVSTKRMHHPVPETGQWRRRPVQENTSIMACRETAQR